MNNITIFIGGSKVTVTESFNTTSDDFTRAVNKAVTYCFRLWVDTGMERGAKDLIHFGAIMDMITFKIRADFIESDENRVHDKLTYFIAHELK